MSLIFDFSMLLYGIFGNLWKTTFGSKKWTAQWNWTKFLIYQGKKIPNSWWKGQLCGKLFRVQQNEKTCWHIYLTWPILMGANRLVVCKIQIDVCCGLQLANRHTDIASTDNSLDGCGPQPLQTCTSRLSVALVFFLYVRAPHDWGFARMYEYWAILSHICLALSFLVVVGGYHP